MLLSIFLKSRIRKPFLSVVHPFPMLTSLPGYPFRCISDSPYTVFSLFRNSGYRPGLFPVRTRRCFFYDFTLPCYRQRIPVLSQIRGQRTEHIGNVRRAAFRKWFLSHLPSYELLPPPASLYLYQSICRYVLPEGRFRSFEVHARFPGGLPLSLVNPCLTHTGKSNQTAFCTHPSVA